MKRWLVATRRAYPEARHAKAPDAPRCPTAATAPPARRRPSALRIGRPPTRHLIGRLRGFIDRGGEHDGSTTSEEIAMSIITILIIIVIVLLVLGFFGRGRF